MPIKGWGIWTSEAEPCWFVWMLLIHEAKPKMCWNNISMHKYHPPFLRCERRWNCWYKWKWRGVNAAGILVSVKTRAQQKLHKLKGSYDHLVQRVTQLQEHKDKLVILPHVNLIVVLQLDWNSKVKNDVTGLGLNVDWIVYYEIAFMFLAFYFSNSDNVVPGAMTWRHYKTVSDLWL